MQCKSTASFKVKSTNIDFVALSSTPRTNAGNTMPVMIIKTGHKYATEKPKNQRKKS